jgi:MFS family permease
MSGKRNKRMAIGAFFMAQGLIFASWASRIPDVKSMLSLSDGELGTLLFTIPIGEAVSIIPTGMLVARYGSKVSAAVALAMYALSLASLPLAGSFWMLAVQLFCLGFSVNVLSVSINTQAVFLEKIYDRSIMSSFHGMWSLGGLTGGIIGAGFAHFMPQLAWHFTSILVVCLLLIAVCYHLLIPGRESADKGETVDFSIRNIDSYIWILGIITFASMFSEGITYDWSSVYFESVVHADNSLIRMGYVAALGAVTLGRFITDRFVERYGAPRILMVCGALMFIGFLMVVVLPYLIPATIGFALIGLGISSVCPLSNSLAGRRSSMKTSTAITIISSIGFIGFLIAPPVIGWMSEAIGLHLTILLGSLSGLLTLIMVRKLSMKLS